MRDDLISAIALIMRDHHPDFPPIKKADDVRAAVFYIWGVHIQKLGNLRGLMTVLWFLAHKYDYWEHGRPQNIREMISDYQSNFGIEFDPEINLPIDRPLIF
jgi:hypothetical protein